MSTKAEPPSNTLAAWLNLVLPGGGLIWIGATATGLLAGVAFAACANVALAAVLLVPDEFGAAYQKLVIGLAAGAYAGAQLRFVQTVRQRRAVDLANQRRESLRRVTACLLDGDAEAALVALQPLRNGAEDDLLVMYRLAQVLTAAGNVSAARNAWRKVRALDRHGIYRRQAEEQERRLG